MISLIEIPSSPFYKPYKLYYVIKRLHTLLKLSCSPNISYTPILATKVLFESLLIEVLISDGYCISVRDKAILSGIEMEVIANVGTKVVI